MDLNPKSLAEQLTDLLEKQEKERLALAEKADKEEPDLFIKQEEDQKAIHEQELSELKQQIQDVENASEQVGDKAGSKKTVIAIVLALVFSLIALAGFVYLKGEQVGLFVSVENNTKLANANSIVSKEALDRGKEAKQSIEAVKLTADEALKIAKSADSKVDVLQKHIDEVVEPGLKTLKSKQADFKRKDKELNDAIQLVNKTLGKNKSALAEREKAKQAKYLAQKSVNDEMSLQIKAMKKETAIIRKNQGMNTQQIMKLTYAECNDSKRSKGYSKKECAKNYEFVEALFGKIKKPVVKTTTTIHALVLETTTRK